MDNVCSFNCRPFSLTMPGILTGPGRDSVGQRRAFQIYATRSTARPLATGSFQADIIRPLTTETQKMNRRKKINQLLKANAKKASAKLAPKSKTKYISKADRAKLEAEASQESAVTSES